MTIQDYQGINRNRAQRLLGEAFDYAVNSLGMPGKDFVDLFLVSSFCKRLELADVAIIKGKSGIELAIDIIKETTDKDINVEPKVNYSRSKEYWIGYAVAYYQFIADCGFARIFRALPYDELARLYYTLHEADITKFVDIANGKIKEDQGETNLKRIRTLYGCSQSELAALSGVNLRSIQMYEQRHKNINKASVDTLKKLSKALGCSIEELLES